ncbi:MAG: hypothetical protein KDB74_09305 [Flavobacteriales bacterium]|nr:hypothetical protein [Flavobacteriales bacterium]
MKQIITFTFLLITLCASAQNIKEELYNLPDVQFTKINTPEAYEAAYELKIKQPIDHKNPSLGYFYQRVFLSHVGFDKATVMVTNGYAKTRNSITEPAALLNANQLNIEHRYFGKSVPDSIDYTYLNLEQVAADLHHINELFRNIYKGKWLSTGISKGGQTTIFYRYFYPKDVDVSIPYVAPINDGLEDTRIYTFLDTVGSDECRTKLKNIQKRLLSEREEVLPLMRWFTYGAQLHFTYLEFEQAFEYAVLEFPFSFWQWGSNCDSIPDVNAPIEDLLYYFVGVSGIDFFADKSMEDFASHYYQAGAQMGYYSYDISEFKDLIKALPNDKNPSAIFMPNKMPIHFNNDVVVKAKAWMQKNGNHFIHINGNSDTWSATALRPVKGLDAEWFFIAGKDHGAARIKNMSKEERTRMVDALERWLNLEIE